MDSVLDWKISTEDGVLGFFLGCLSGLSVL